VGMVIDVDNGMGGTTRGLGSPVVLNGTISRHATSIAPKVGQHSREVLSEFGFGDEEIERLERDGVIHQDTP